LDLAQTFGIVLRKHRRKVGFSQEKLAELCGIERTYVSMLERAERRPSLAMTFELAQALEISPSVFVSEMEYLLNKD